MISLPLGAREWGCCIYSLAYERSGVKDMLITASETDVQDYSLIHQIIWYSASARGTRRIDSIENLDFYQKSAYALFEDPVAAGPTLEMNP